MTKTTTKELDILQFDRILHDRPNNDLVVEVKRQTETRLVRRWVTVLDLFHYEMFERRSVILCAGINNIQITWRKGKDAVACEAALYETRTSLPYLASAPILRPCKIVMSLGNHTAILTWDLLGTP